MKWLATILLLLSFAAVSAAQTGTVIIYRVNRKPVSWFKQAVYCDSVHVGDIWKGRYLKFTADTGKHFCHITGGEVAAGGNVVYFVVKPDATTYIMEYFEGTWTQRALLKKVDPTIAAADVAELKPVDGKHQRIDSSPRLEDTPAE